MECQQKKECKRRNELRDYKRVFANEKLLFRNGFTMCVLHFAQNIARW
jgi:regulator of replication initiation timing